MADRRDNNILPLVAGVVLSAGILALLYKMFFTGGKPKFATHNQQIAAPTECICARGGKNLLLRPYRQYSNSQLQSIEFFSSEERDRRERERKRQEAARARAEEAAFEPDEEPEPGFSPLKIAGGTLGFLLAFIALLLKTVDKETLRAYLDIVGLGHLIPKPKLSPCLNPARQKWPVPPPPPPCPPPPKKREPKPC